jgi:hypothetical protein
MSQGGVVQGIGWQQIEGPPAPLAIDTSSFNLGGPYRANIRADNQIIGMWQSEAQATSGRVWAFWTPSLGWNQGTLPDDYLGGVGWMPALAQDDASFVGVELANPGLGNQAIRVSRIAQNAYIGGQNAWWPNSRYWNVDFPPFGEAHIAMNEALGGPLSAGSFIADALDDTTISYFATPLDPAHIWLLYNPDFPDPAIGGAFLGFNTYNGSPDKGVFLDLNLGNYTQNFGRSVALWQGAGVNSLVFNPTGTYAFGQMTYSAGFGSFPDRMLGVYDFDPTAFGIFGPIFCASADNTAGLSPLASVDVRPANERNTLYFPNTGVPGYAWENTPLPTGAQLQMTAICTSDPFYGSLPSGMQDQFATVSPYHITDPTDPNYPNIQGIIYCPFWQGFQGLPVGVLWPETAVAPWYVMLQSGRVYLIDSATPQAQMFELAVQTASFACEFDCFNWVRPTTE